MNINLDYDTARARADRATSRLALLWLALACWAGARIAGWV